MNSKSYKLDLKELFSDLVLKDLLAEEDGKFWKAVGGDVETPLEKLLRELLKDERKDSSFKL